MKVSGRQKIVIIGCGSVAWQIAKHLRSLNRYEIKVYNHRPNPLLKDFKTKLKCSIGTGLSKADPDADIYFICVSDRAIATTALVLEIRNPKAILVHTSGSIKLGDLAARTKSTGVFYPLQSFSKKDEITWREVPIILEGNSARTEKVLMILARQFSDIVRVVPYKDRLSIHLAAVVVNNFTNALYVEAKQFLEKETRTAGFDLMLPLIRKTTSKLSLMSPLQSQTGPAKRKDKLVLKKHLELLKDRPDLHKLYRQLSKLIVKQQESKENEL